MSKRNWMLFIEDIVESIRKIDEYIKKIEYKQFAEDEKTVDAVVRNLEIIGEASKNIPGEIKEKYKEINWKGIAGLRDRIVHQYFGIDLELIWFIIKNELSPIKDKLNKIKKI